MEDLLGFADIAVTPIYLLIMLAFVRAYAAKYFLNTPLYSYYVNAFLLKAFGSIAIGLVYFYYFGNGDTLYYFKSGAQATKVFLEDPGTNWIFFFPEFYYDNILQLTGMPIFFLRKANAFMMVRLSAFLNIFTFSSYFGTGLFFALFSFLGSWKLFQVFYDLYPKAHKRIAFSVLYFPSVVMWGSGIFKDTVTLGSLGFLIYAVYMLFVKGKFSFRHLFMFLLSFYMIGIVKSYVLMALVPSMIFYVMNQYTNRIKSAFVRTTLLPFVLVLVTLLSVVSLNSMSTVFSAYSIENLEDKMEGFQRWHTKRSQQTEGSGYTLGIEAGAGMAGALIKFPLAVNVTLFRPYLWEARKPFVFISAVESFFVLLLTLRTIQMIGLRSLLRSLLGDPFISFCFVFAIIFAFGIGVTSYNFGALVRFKIQCMPFYLGALYLSRYKYLTENNLPLSNL